MQIVPGETALAFYTVKNCTDKNIIGVATYNVHPPKAGTCMSVRLVRLRSPYLE